MIVAEVDSASLARLRLCPSPAHELVSWLRLVSNGRRHPTYGDPGAAARTALLDRDVALAAAVLPPAGYVPDLLTPKPPLASSHTLNDQLDLVADTAAEVVMSQLHAHPSLRRLNAEVRTTAETGVFAGRVASGMRKFWGTVLDDVWAPLRTNLEADIAVRTRALARRGLGDVLNNLHPDLLWNGSRIEVRKPYNELTHLASADFVLAPSALGWPSLAVQLVDPSNAVICYPAEGIGVRSGAGPAGWSAVSELVGPTRNQLLRHLAAPHSTADLSSSTGLAPATISYHLSVLHRSGLLIRQRTGRTVLYQRSARGDTLVVDA